LADAAAGAAAEEIAGLQRENIRGVFDLLFGREDELQGIAVLFDLTIHREADEQVLVVGREGARHQKRPGRCEIVVPLAVEPIGAQAGTIRRARRVFCGRSGQRMAGRLCGATGWCHTSNFGCSERGEVARSRLCIHRPAGIISRAARRVLQTAPQYPA
jgi:hypothetical protein